LPFLTIIAKSAIPDCADKLSPQFRVRRDNDVVIYSLENFANGAADTFQSKPGIKAWYLADTAPGSVVAGPCGGAAACARAELVVLQAEAGTFTFEPVVAHDICHDAQVAFRLGMAVDGPELPLTFVPADAAPSITIKVPSP
jgi:hypothetical protein